MSNSEGIFFASFIVCSCCVGLLYPQWGLGVFAVGLCVILVQANRELTVEEEGVWHNRELPFRDHTAQLQAHRRERAAEEAAYADSRFGATLEQAQVAERDRSHQLALREVETRVRSHLQSRHSSFELEKEQAAFLEVQALQE